MAAELLDLLERYGVNHIICSPGSRNAALLVEAEAHPSIRKHIIVDERTAAFIALGIATICQAPVALICTSGSALLNYAPAVAEAYYQGIPLIVISADRPSEWIDQDDSQTIRQMGPLDNFVKGSYDLNGDSASGDEIWYANRLINEGLQNALTSKKGPVQFNIHLNGKVGAPLLNVHARFISKIIPQQHISLETIKELANFAKDLRILITVGFMSPDAKMQKAFTILHSLPNVVILAETVSNLHLPRECYVIDKVLFNIDEIKEKLLQPDLVISVGGALISRKLKEYIRRCDILAHWTIGHSHNIIDCFKSITTRIEADASSFLMAFSRILKRRQNVSQSLCDFKNEWNIAREETFVNFKSIVWSDLKAMYMILNKLPRETNLFLSNGTAVRYGQIIPYKVTHGTYSNRGVSGIEGCTSTAIGCSMAYERLTCLITGDMSFSYDLGGLASGMANRNLVIIVLDNGGGDIFRFINATKELEIREKYLSVERKIPVRQLAEAYGFEYRYADSEKDLKTQLITLFQPTTLPKILHVVTKKSKNNTSILRNYLTTKL